MKNTRNKTTLLVGVFILIIATITPVVAKEMLPQNLVGVGIEEKLGLPVSVNTPFKNASGQTVTLGSMLNNKPIILNLVYFNCPMLCQMVLTSFHDSLSKLPFTVRDRFDIVSLSFDPNDTVQTAAAFKEKYHGENNKSDQKWSFLTGTKTNIKALTDSVGFTYKLDPKTGEYAHSAALVVLNQDGNISRYIRGIEYKPFTLKMAILEAIDNKTVSTIEKGLLYCYTFDSSSNSYALEAMSIMRVGGAVTVFVLLILFVILNRKRNRTI
ncbi:MAG: SCO family protein [Candidatus Margulisbacteria bacterium]|nr:SCO family protein [Candidatus Margulisiibacteriota bacterium]